jgi:hypothetical protein
MSIDLEKLLKLRLVVAHFGEMDLARWWNTKAQLGLLGRWRCAAVFLVLTTSPKPLGLCGYRAAMQRGLRPSSLGHALAAA